jgi:hypothetical protein
MSVAAQSRTGSLFEVAANVLVGYALAVFVQLLVFPIYGLQPTLGQNLKIGLIFTGVSLARSYALRRLFQRLSPPRRV